MVYTQQLTHCLTPLYFLFVVFCIHLYSILCIRVNTFGEKILDFFISPSFHIRILIGQYPAQATPPHGMEQPQAAPLSASTTSHKTAAGPGHLSGACFVRLKGQLVIF